MGGSQPGVGGSQGWLDTRAARRKTKKNWDSWGDQVGLFDKKKEVVTRKSPSKWIETREQLKLIC